MKNLLSKRRNKENKFITLSQELFSGEKFEDNKRKIHHTLEEINEHER